MKNFGSMGHPQDNSAIDFDYQPRRQRKQGYPNLCLAKQQHAPIKS